MRLLGDKQSQLTHLDPGDLVERYAYDPYGNRQVYQPQDASDATCTRFSPNAARVLDPSGVATSVAINTVSFQGLLLDEATRLINNRATIYSPSFSGGTGAASGGGRFLQRDPLGYPDGMNTYAAYHVMHQGVDPSGLTSPTQSNIQKAIDAEEYEHAQELIKEYHEEHRAQFRSYLTMISSIGEAIDEITSHLDMDISYRHFSETGECCKGGKLYKANIKGTQLHLGIVAEVSINKEWFGIDTDGGKIPDCMQEGAYTEIRIGPTFEKKAGVAGAKLKAEGGILSGPGGITAVGSLQGEGTALNFAVQAGIEKHPTAADAAIKTWQSVGAGVKVKVGTITWYDLSLEPQNCPCP